MTTPINRFMPPEWAPHDATWMGFPREAYPGAGVTDDEVAKAWTDVANIISEFGRQVLVAKFIPEHITEIQAS